MHFGTPTDRMRTCFTHVLKGMIALSSAVFPEGVLGSRLDALARTSLWTAGLDYNHGTGHGVGAFLNVHEGPQGIGYRKRENEVVRHCQHLLCSFKNCH
jgi:Xaa-Pro aminopeptidase